MRGGPGCSPGDGQPVGCEGSRRPRDTGAATRWSQKGRVPPATSRPCPCRQQAAPQSEATWRTRAGRSRGTGVRGVTAAPPAHGARTVLHSRLHVTFLVFSAASELASGRPVGSAPWPWRLLSGPPTGTLRRDARPFPHGACQWLPALRGAVNPPPPPGACCGPSAPGVTRHPPGPAPGNTCGP